MNNATIDEENEINFRNISVDDFMKNGALIILDTNIWLDIYRNLPENILIIIDILKNKFIKDRTYIPAYVKTEFLKNFHKLEAVHNKIETSTNDALINITKDFSDRLTKEINIRKERFHILEKNENEKSIYSLLVDLGKQVENFIEYNDSENELKDIAVCDDVKKLFDSYCNTNLIDNLSKEEVLMCIQEGELRFESKTPPGYMDEKKVKRNGFIYGDLLIWYEIIKFSSKKKTNILFVTNDTKEDWFENSSFHPKLIAEFANKTKQNIMGITGAQFYDYINCKNIIPGKIFGGIDGYIKNHIDELVDSCESDVFNYINDELQNEYNSICDNNILSQYDGEYYECEGLDCIELIDKEFQRFDDEVEIIITYLVTFSITSAGYHGRDDDTKEVILSPYRTHKVEGHVKIKINKNVTEFYTNLYGNNDIEIYNSECKETSYDDGYRYEYEEEILENHCPDCGCIMTEENYGGNGFCSDCASRH